MKNIFQHDKKEELQWLKENIDIRQYLEASGYTLDKSRNTRRYMAYHHEARGDKIYVPLDNRYPVPSYYVNQFDKIDKGTIVDFVMSREKKSLEEARLLLKDFHPVPAGKENTKEQLRAEGDAQQKRHRYVMDKILKEGALKDYSYLRSRFLEEDTIQARAFRGKVLQNEAPDGRFWVFPLREPGQKGVEGMALKNAEGERVLGKRQGLWISNPDKNIRASVEQVLITESPIDAMSYYQLYKDRKENTVFISTAGNPAKEQLKAVKEYIREHNILKVVLGSDNDKAGRQYNKDYRELIGELNREGKGRAVEIKEVVPVFKDFNADIRARKLLELRQLEQQDMSRPRHLEQMQPLKEELEKLLYEKNYRKLGRREIVSELQHSYVLKELEGRNVRFSVREVALINNQPKLLQLLEQKGSEEKIEPVKIKEQRVLQANSATKLQVEEPRENPMLPADKPPLGRASAVSKDTPDHQLEKAYFKTIDKLQKQISGKEEFSALYQRLDMYRKYPHLNEEEIDTYLGLQQRLSGGLQQQISITKGKGKELDGPGL
jgi:hypothetical protein